MCLNVTFRQTNSFHKHPLYIFSFHNHTCSHFALVIHTLSHMVWQGQPNVNSCSMTGFVFFLSTLNLNRNFKILDSEATDNSGDKITHLLQLIMISSGLMRRFSMPIFGWSPRPRKRPGGSMRKFPILSLWLSMMQKPYSWRSLSFSSLIFYKGYEKRKVQSETSWCFLGWETQHEYRSTCFSSLDICFLASDWALKYSFISLKLHLFRSVIFDFSSDVISYNKREGIWSMPTLNAWTSHPL